MLSSSIYILNGVDGKQKIKDYSWQCPSSRFKEKLQGCSVALPFEMTARAVAQSITHPETADLKAVATFH